MHFISLRGQFFPSPVNSWILILIIKNQDDFPQKQWVKYDLYQNPCTHCTHPNDAPILTIHQKGCQEV